MRRQTTTNKQGFTLVEMMVTIVIAAIVILGLANVMADAHRGYRQTYDRVYSDVVVDAYVARRAFDAVVRRSTIMRYDLDPSFQYVYVYYYSNIQNLSITEPDSYAKFYISGTDLMVDYGDVSSAGTWNTFEIADLSASSTKTLAGNVQEANFTVAGKYVQMALTLDNGRESMTVASSAVRHNGWNE